MPKISLMDTTLRDGEQMQGVSFTPKEKLSITQLLLEEAKVDRIEVASARVSKGEAKAVKRIAQWAEGKGFLEKVEVLGFVDLNKSADWMLEAGVISMNLLAKGSLKHVKQQLGKSREEHFEDVGKTVEYAESKGIKTSVFLEDWSNGMLESKEYVMQFVKALSGMPIDKIYLTDTLGILTPSQTKQFVEEMAKEFPKKCFEFHAHNDYGLASANSLAAIKAGCLGAHVTVNGLGERAGNAALDEVVVLINDKTGFECGVLENKLGKVSRLVEAFSGKRVSANKAIAGSNVFTQTAGIHADGDKKAGLYESMLKPERFGKEREYALGKLSGKASLDKNLEKVGLELSEEDKKKVLKRIIELGDMKKIITTEDLPYLVLDVIGTPEESRIKILNCMVSSGLGIKPSASFTIKANGKEFSESAVGDGGYNAFMNALRKVSGKLGLKLPLLADYEVRIPPGGKTDALVETTITWEKEGKTFNTIGVDSDQVMAAVKATEKMLNVLARNGKN